MRAEATITSLGTLVEPSVPTAVRSASAAARCRNRSSELLSAHCRSSKLRQTGWKRRDLEEESRQGAEDVVGLAAEIDLLVRLARQVLAELRRDAKQLAAIVVDDAQQAHQRLGGEPSDVGAGQVRRRRAATSRRSWNLSSAMSWRMISTNGWKGDRLPSKHRPS